MLTIEYLKENNLIIFEAITGSQAYGTAEEGSDIDIKGVFILPMNLLLTDDYTPLVSDEKNDKNYYEIGRYIELLNVGNPTALELLYSYDDIIIYKSDLFDELLINRDLYLTKILKNSFGKYAGSQIQKARGLNKKIVNKIDPIKKSPIDFCFVISSHESYTLTEFLSKNNYNQKFCGLVKVPNAEGIFALYYDEYSHLCFDESIPEQERDENKLKYKDKFKFYKGIIKESENGDLVSNEIRYSSISKDANHIINFYYNKNGYTIYCKDYTAYYEWVEKRNAARYNTNMKHNKGYDGKNLSHCHRLLDICIEIGEEKGFSLKRENVKQLLDIKHGVYEYDNLILEADDKIKYINELYDNCSLPNEVDKVKSKEILLNIRKKFYGLSDN